VKKQFLLQCPSPQETGAKTDSVFVTALIFFTVKYAQTRPGVNWQRTRAWRYQTIEISVVPRVNVKRSSSLTKQAKAQSRPSFADKA
jgi:hypothetical protein